MELLGRRDWANSLGTQSTPVQSQVSMEFHHLVVLGHTEEAVPADALVSQERTPSAPAAPF